MKQTCPKCGTSRDHHRWPFEIKYEWDKPTDVLSVCCGRCGYSWMEPPADAKTK